MAVWSRLAVGERDGHLDVMIRQVAASAFALSLLSSALARAEASSKPVQPYVDLQTIGFPAVVHGRLVNYIFAVIRLNIAPGVDASRIQQGEPFLRDALVHASARTPFNPPEDGVRLDAARLRAEVMKDARAQFGPGKVDGVVIRSAMPQRRTGVPGGSGLDATQAPK